MTFEPGARLGPYEIVSTIGAGGMGEVYKARDTRLDRTVAIKVIGAGFAGTPELRERFEREARAISQLNHPAICTLHDVGYEGDTSYIVLEHLDGESLAARIARGPLAADEALPIAIGVCEALDAAHRQGVVHRDLKPANIMLVKRGVPKLLDFGLAKLAPAATASGSLTLPTTQTTPLTARGTMMGTFQYMSPEQLEGAAADARSDIWAFGCVLFEMLTGRRAFEGKTQASLISAILTSQPPPIATVQPLAPPPLDYTVQTCLAKNPDERFQNAHDLLLQLRWVQSAGSQAGVPAAVVATRRRRANVRMLGAIAAAVAMTAGVTWWLTKTDSPPPATMLRAHLPLAPLSYNSAVSHNFAISPDGTHLVFASVRDDAVGLHIQDLRTGVAKPLSGSSGGIMPFFSPDGESVGFLGSGKLNKVLATGGSASTICDLAVAYGATWGPDDTIIFAGSANGPLLKVSALGGQPVQATTLHAGEIGHRWPSILPDGKTLLYAAGTGGGWSDALVIAERLDGSSRVIVARGGTTPRYAPSGHVVFGRGGTLHAVPFDARRGVVLGPPRPLGTDVAFTEADGRLQFAVSQSGLLIYVDGGAQTQPKRTLAWVTRAGRVDILPAPPRGYEHPRIAPNGQYIATTIRGEGDPDIWVLDLARTTLSRFTFEAGEDESPVWTPDSASITFSSSRAGKQRQTLSKRLDGVGGEQELFTSARHQHLGGWAPDQNTLLSEEVDSTWTIYASPRGGTGAAWLTTAFPKMGVQVSPDGKWVAYSSNESGPSQVYVHAFPGPGARFQVSSDGGSEPMWSPARNELFYRHGDAMMVVPVQLKPTFTFGTARVLFEGRFTRMGWAQANYDVSRDGTRFLMIRGDDDPLPREFKVITNWAQELPALAPAGK